MVDGNYEGEMAVIVIEDEQGNELYYEEEMVIPFEGKSFAILVSLPDHEHEEGCGCDFEPEVIIARIDKNDTGEDEYVAPTDEEFNAVLNIYEEIGEEE